MNGAFLGVQVISILFAFFMMYVVRIHFHRNNLGKREYIFWLFIWLVFIFVAALPQIFSPLLNLLQIVRIMDLMMIIAFMILTYISFMDHIAIRDLYRKINQVVSEKSQKHPRRSSKK